MFKIVIFFVVLAVVLVASNPIDRANNEELAGPIVEQDLPSPVADQVAVESIVDTVVVPAPNNEDNDIFEVAETHIFRPLFSYRAQQAKRLKYKKVADYE